MKKPVRVGGIIILALAAFWVWWSVASNYDVGFISGTYVFRNSVTKCILYLRPDGTFSQELNSEGGTQNAQGHWIRYGEAHVEFSNEFLNLPGEELDAAGHAHGQFEKTLGIFPILVLAPIENGPKFHRRLLH